MNSNEPQITLHRRPLLVGLGGVEGTCLVAAFLVSQRMEDPRTTASGALLGVALVGTLFLAGALVVASGKPRAASLLPTLWLGATIARVMGLLIAVLPIYFAAPQILPAFAVGAGGAYLACLAVETALIARQALR